MMENCQRGQSNSKLGITTDHTDFTGPLENSVYIKNVYFFIYFIAFSPKLFYILIIIHYYVSQIN